MRCVLLFVVYLVVGRLKVGWEEKGKVVGGFIDGFVGWLFCLV